MKTGKNLQEVNKVSIRQTEVTNFESTGRSVTRKMSILKSKSSKLGPKAAMLVEQNDMDKEREETMKISMT